MRVLVVSCVITCTLTCVRSVHLSRSKTLLFQTYTQHLQQFLWHSNCSINLSPLNESMTVPINACFSNSKISQLQVTFNIVLVSGVQYNGYTFI